jgi:hypothetical protein
MMLISLRNDLVLTYKGLLEAQQKILDSQHGTQAALKRNQELQTRCDELASRCESERKARYATILKHFLV